MAHHGNTPAAWTGVTIILVGFTVGGIGLMVDSWPMFWVGVALCPIGGSSARSCRRWAWVPRLITRLRVDADPGVLRLRLA